MLLPTNKSDHMNQRNLVPLKKTAAISHEISAYRNRRLSDSCQHVWLGMGSAAHLMQLALDFH